MWRKYTLIILFLAVFCGLVNWIVIEERPIRDLIEDITVASSYYHHLNTKHKLILKIL